MAYVNSMRPTYHAGASAATQTPNLSSHATNDLLVIAMQWANGGTVSLTTGSGWVKALEATSPGTLSIWYKVAGASETAPTFTCTNSGDRCAVCLTIKDAPTTSPIDITASTSETKNLGATTYKGTLSSVTTTTDDALCLLFTSANNAFYTAQVANTIPHLMTGVSAESMTVSSLTYPSSGAQDALTFYVSRAAAITHLFVQIIVKNDAGGGVRGQLDTSALPSTLVTTWSDGGTNTDISNAGTALVADLDGDTTAHEALQTSSSKSILPYAANSVVYWAGYHVLNEASSAETSAAVDAVETLDLSNSLIAATINGSGFEGWKPYATGGQYIGLANTSLAGATYFKVAASDTKAKTATGSIPVVFNTGSADGRFVDGTDDLTDVNDVFLGGNKDSTSSFVCGPIHKLNTLILIGGNTAKPTNCADLVLFALNMGLNTVLAQNNLSDGQYFILQSFQIGNGSKPTNWQSRNQSIEFPGAYSEADLNIAARIPKSGLAFTLYASSSDTIDLTNTTINFGDYHTATIHASGSTSAAYNFSGCTWINPGAPTLKTGISYTGLTITGGEEIQHDASTTIDQSSTPVLNGVTVDNVATGETAAVIVSTETQFANVVTGATFTNNTNAPAIRITGDQTYTGVGWDDPGLTVSGNTVDIEYTGATPLQIQSAVALTVTGNLTIVTPSTTLRIDPDITITANGSMRYFNGTPTDQDVTDSGTGDFLDYTYATTAPIDIEVVEQYYVPVNQQGVTPIDGTRDITMDFDEAYNDAHGLVIGALNDYTYTRTSTAVGTLTINDDQSAFDVYSALSDLIRTNSSYYNTKLLLEAKPGGKRIDQLGGLTVTSMATWKGAGSEVYHVDDAINPIAKYYSIQSVSDITGATVVYRQTNSGDFTIGSLTSGKFDEALPFYRDDNHDGDTADVDEYNRNSYLLIKALRAGYKQARNDVVAGNGGLNLRSDLYVIGLNPESHSYSGTPIDLSATMTLTAGTFVIGGKTFSYKWTDTGNNSGTNIADWINYMGATSPNGLIPGGTGLRWAEMPDMVIHVSGGVETERGYQEGATPTLVGFYCQRGVSDHPDFIRFQADDGTYYTPAVQVSILMPNIPDGARVRIYNEDSSAEIDNSLVTGGGGYSFALLYTADINISYKVNWHSGTNAKLPLTGIGVITSAGFTLLDSMEDDTKHNALGFDGEAIDLDASPATGEIKADFANIQIDANDPDGVFDSRKGIAWWRYICSTATGIATYNPKALQYNPDVRNIEVDGQLQIENIHPTLPLKVTEGLWIRKDGASIIASTSNTVWWVPNDRVYQGPETGVSGLTAAESAKLDTIGTVNTNTSAIKAKTDQLTFTAPNVVDASASVSEASIRAAIGLASANLDTQLATITEDTNELQTNQGNWITATGFATVNPDNASIAVIKGKTDQLTFTLANQVDANAQSINDNAVTGDGSEADPWRKTGVTP